MTTPRSKPRQKPSHKAEASCTASTKPVQVLVVDDHPVVREGVCRTIERQKDMAVCGEAASAGEAIAILEQCACDLAIVDISIEGRSGIDLIKDMTARGIECPVLVLTVHDDTSYAERALRAGARGYVLKQAGSQEIVTALRRILAGEVHVCDRMSAKLISGLVGSRKDAPGGSPVARLSDRELEVLEAIGNGQGTQAIARGLALGVSTVESYKANLKTKLELKNAAELAAFAARWLAGQA